MASKKKVVEANNENMHNATQSMAMPHPSGPRIKNQPSDSRIPQLTAAHILTSAQIAGVPDEVMKTISVMDAADDLEDIQCHTAFCIAVSCFPKNVELQCYVGQKVREAPVMEKLEHAALEAGKKFLAFRRVFKADGTTFLDTGIFEVPLPVEHRRNIEQELYLYWRTMGILVRDHADVIGPTAAMFLTLIGTPSPETIPTPPIYNDFNYDRSGYNVPDGIPTAIGWN